MHCGQARHVRICLYRTDAVDLMLHVNLVENSHGWVQVESLIPEGLVGLGGERVAHFDKVAGGWRRV
jgi:hypothetical protein